MHEGHTRLLLHGVDIADGNLVSRVCQNYGIPTE